MSSPPAPPPLDLRPLSTPMTRIVGWGVIAWLAALAVTLAVPALHEPPRELWPWTCGVGAALGLVGLAYLHRRRGNAAAA